MAYANTLKVFELLRPAFDEKQATKISEAIESALETNNSALFSQMATKGDLEKLEERFERRLAETKTDIIKWMFIFWVGQVASIVGILSAILFAFFK